MISHPRARPFSLALPLVVCAAMSCPASGRPSGGRYENTPSFEGFEVRDVAAGSEYVPIQRQALGLRLRCKKTKKRGANFFDAVLMDTTGKDRAVTLLYAMRPVEGAGWRWLEDPFRDQVIDRSRSYISRNGDSHPLSYNFDTVGACPNPVSRYPFAAITDGERGVAIVQVDVDIERLTAFFDKIPDHETTQYGKHTLHTWTKKGHGGGQTSITASAHDKGIVLGRNGSDVKAALDVLDGRAASLADGNSPLAGAAFSEETVGGGVAFQVRAVGLAGPDIPFKSPIIRQSESLVMVAGEREGQAFARARLTAKSDEVARQMLSVVEGFVATARLQCGDNEEAKKLLENLAVTADGKAVTVEWKGSADGMLRFVEKRMAKHQDGKRKPK